MNILPKYIVSSASVLLLSAALYCGISFNNQKTSAKPIINETNLPLVMEKSSAQPIHTDYKDHTDNTDSHESELDSNICRIIEDMRRINFMETTKEDSLLESTDFYHAYYRVGPKDKDTVVALTLNAINDLFSVMNPNLYQNKTVILVGPSTHKLFIGELYRRFNLGKDLNAGNPDSANDKYVCRNNQWYKFKDTRSNTRRLVSSFRHGVRNEYIDCD